MIRQCPPLPKHILSSLWPSPIPTPSPAVPLTPGWPHRMMLHAAGQWQHWHCSALGELGQVPETLSGRSSGGHSRANRSCVHALFPCPGLDTCLKPGLIWKTLGFWVEVLLISWTSTQGFSISFQTSRSKRDGIFPPLRFPCKRAF